MIRLGPRWIGTGLRESLSRMVCCHFSNGKGSPQKDIFDRGMKRRQRKFSCELHDFPTYQYVKEEIGSRVADKVWDIKRTFNTGIELSSGTGFIAHHLNNNVIESLILCDTSLSNLDRTALPDSVYTSKLLVDEEHLPFRDECAEIFLSSLTLHWVNKLPQLFKEVMRCLQKDGVFLGAIFGGQTLYELRCSLQLAESEREGGFAPHISPFVEPTDIGALLNRAGFNLLTIDTDEMIVKYPTMFELISDLQMMGESNAAWNRRLHLHRDSMLAAAAVYREFYGDEEGNIPATFQITNFIGWKPHESQPKPAARGSATVSFKDVGNLDKMMDRLKEKKAK